MIASPPSINNLSRRPREETPQSLLLTHRPAMATSALDECVSKVDTLILEVSKGMEGADAPRMTVDPDDPWAEIWNPPSHVFKVSRARAWREPPTASPWLGGEECVRV